MNMSNVRMISALEVFAQRHVEHGRFSDNKDRSEFDILGEAAGEREHDDRGFD